MKNSEIFYPVGRGGPHFHTPPVPHRTPLDRRGAFGPSLALLSQPTTLDFDPPLSNCFRRPIRFLNAFASTTGWLGGSVVGRRSLIGELALVYSLHRTCS